MRGVRVRERFTPQHLHAPSLDWLNFLVADVRGGLGPYVIVYLVLHHGWTPTAVGLVTTVGGWLGLAAQTPIGAWLDRTDRKRGALLWALLVLAAGALVIAWVPRFWPVLLANGAMRVVSGVFEPAVASLTVGLCAREALTARMGRNAAWSRAGNLVCQTRLPAPQRYTQTRRDGSSGWTGSKASPAHSRVVHPSTAAHDGSRR